MKQALLAVSFGTSVPQARESIAAVEAVMRESAPGWDFFRAFTSPTIRRILEKRGEQVPGLADALEQLCEEGYTHVAVQPTHMLYGHEYDAMKAVVDGQKMGFRQLLLGKPLLADTQDLQGLAALLGQEYPAVEDETLLLFGHGTAHFANAVYPALQTAFQLQNRPDVLLGTVEGWPGFDDALAQLEQSGRKAVHLVPLMLVAGDHAMNDMAGDGPESWKSRFSAAEFQVRCTLSGLGMLPGVRKIYCTHLESLLRESDTNHGV